MKPHEETWAAGEHPYGKGMQVEVRDASGRHICIFHSFDPSSDRARQRRARFVAAAPAMARALLAFIAAMDGSQCAEDSENARLQAEAALMDAGVLE